MNLNKTKLMFIFNVQRTIIGREDELGQMTKSVKYENVIKRLVKKHFMKIVTKRKVSYQFP